MLFHAISWCLPWHTVDTHEKYIRGQNMECISIYWWFRFRLGGHSWDDISRYIFLAICRRGDHTRCVELCHWSLSTCSILFIPSFSILFCHGCQTALIQFHRWKYLEISGYLVSACQRAFHFGSFWGTFSFENTRGPLWRCDGPQDWSTQGRRCDALSEGGGWKSLAPLR